MPILICILLSFIPAFLYASLLYWLDRYEKEPKYLLGGAFLWGAVVSVAVAYVLNTIFGVGVYLFTGSEGISDIAMSSISAPLVEETLKGLAVLIIFLVIPQEFDSVLDGMVYAGVTALGFAASENVIYLYQMGYLEDGWEGVRQVFLLRVVLGAWGHAFFTSFIGIGLALARLSRSRSVRLLAPLGCWLLAMFTHFMHNTLATLSSGFDSLVLVFAVDWAGWLLMALIGAAALWRERSWVRTQLLEEVSSGLLSEAQYQIAISRLRRTWAQIGSRMRGRYRHTHRFYTLCTELAYKKHQYQRLGEGKANPAALIEQLRQELGELSPHV